MMRLKFHRLVSFMPYNVLYSDLSSHYDLMCADIDYQAQSHSAARFHQIFGNAGRLHLDLACGTGPHIQYFIKAGYQCSGLDLNQPMLDIAQQRCPDAAFILGNMCNFRLQQPVDLITCFLYSIHYSGDLSKLADCLDSIHKALKTGGVLCFNLVDKNKINNALFERHSVEQNNNRFTFCSAWHYSGTGDKQSLNLSIEKTTAGVTQSWQDQHPMVALTIDELEGLLRDHFEVHIFEHDYDKITPWNKVSGNAIIVAVKR